MLDPVGFWSYARLDDAHSDGQLSQLRAIVGKAIGLQYGGEVVLWQDVAAIPHGADWAETIERTIGQTTFFIPIVTPRYLKSEKCRDEFRAFRQRMLKLGRNDLIFPVHYVNVDNIRPEETAFGDDLAALRRSQWIDFRPLFYADPKSPEVRRWAGDLAGSVLGAVRKSVAAAVETTPPAPRVETLEETVAEAETPPAAEAAPASIAPPPPAFVTKDPVGSRGRWIAAAVVALALILAGIGYFGTRKTADIVALPAPTPTTVAAKPSAPAPIGAPSPSATAVVTAAPTIVAAPAKSRSCEGLGASAASRAPGVLTTSEECGLEPKDAFKECVDCPAMVVLPPGAFTMGSPDSEPDHRSDESPQHEVRIAKPFAVGEFHVTVDEFKAFVTATGYGAGSSCYSWNGKSWEMTAGRSWRDPGFPQTGSHPAACVSWDDAQAYVKWLSDRTGRPYRLLSEAEWEYAARARTQPGSYPKYFFGDSDADFCKYGNGADRTAQSQVPGAKDWTVLPCDDGFAYTSPVGSFKPNDFGLFDMAGNVWQWTADCYHENYLNAPKDGSNWTDAKCDYRVLRGGSWLNFPRNLRAAIRFGDNPDFRGIISGFRVARTLTL